VPIHEIHHNEPKHHAATALPPVSLADFKKQGGTLSGREERFDGFEGEPRAIGSSLGSASTGRHTGPHSSQLENKLDPRVDSDRDGSRNLGGTSSGYERNTGPHSSQLENKLDPRVDSDRDGSRNLGGTSSGYGSGTPGYGHDSTSTTGKKPSLLDRLNPMKDTDGDGKKGVLE
jgi:hypothetical protein